eukprot:SAG11_NODE_604_length_8248_cov_6.574251_7_plen_260_part_00
MLSAAGDRAAKMMDHRIPAHARAMLHSNVRIYMDDMLSVLPYVVKERDDGASASRVAIIEDELYSDRPRLTGTPLHSPPVKMILQPGNTFVGQRVLTLEGSNLCAMIDIPGSAEMHNNLDTPSLRLQPFSSHMSNTSRLSYINIYIVLAERRCTFALHQYNTVMTTAIEFALTGWPLRLFVEALRRRILRLNPAAEQGRIAAHQLAATTISAALQRCRSHIQLEHISLTRAADVMVRGLSLFLRRFPTRPHAGTVARAQ